jgi:hypothetical protein
MQLIISRVFVIMFARDQSNVVIVEKVGCGRRSSGDGISPPLQDVSEL